MSRLTPAPVTSVYIVIFTLYQGLLAKRVSRAHQNVCIARNKKDPTTSNPDLEDDNLLTAIGDQTDFLANVPMSLLIALYAEGIGANKKCLAWALAGMLFCRVVRDEDTSRLKGGEGWGNFIGTWGTSFYRMGMVGWIAKIFWDV